MADPGSYRYWLDSGTSNGAHAYGNIVKQTDVIHSGREAYRLSPTDGGGNGDIDRTMFIDAEQHPRDFGGSSSSSGSGFHLYVSSGAGTSNSIQNTECIAGFSNGSEDGGYGVKLKVEVTSPHQAYITNTQFDEAELERVWLLFDVIRNNLHSPRRSRFHGLSLLCEPRQWHDLHDCILHTFKHHRHGNGAGVELGHLELPLSGQSAITTPGLQAYLES